MNRKQNFLFSIFLRRTLIFITPSMCRVPYLYGVRRTDDEPGWLFSNLFLQHYSLPLPSSRRSCSYGNSTEPSRTNSIPLWSDFATFGCSRRPNDTSPRRPPANATKGGKNKNVQRLSSPFHFNMILYSYVLTCSFRRRRRHEHMKTTIIHDKRYAKRMHIADFPIVSTTGPFRKDIDFRNNGNTIVYQTTIIIVAVESLAGQLCVSETRST